MGTSTTTTTTAPTKQKDPPGETANHTRSRTASFSMATHSFDDTMADDSISEASTAILDAQYDNPFLRSLDRFIGADRVQGVVDGEDETELGDDDETGVYDDDEDDDDTEYDEELAGIQDQVALKTAMLKQNKNTLQTPTTTDPSTIEVAPGASPVVQQKSPPPATAAATAGAATTTAAVAAALGVRTWCFFVCFCPRGTWRRKSIRRLLFFPF